MLDFSYYTVPDSSRSFQRPVSTYVRDVVRLKTPDVFFGHSDFSMLAEHRAGCRVEGHEEKADHP